MVNSDFNIFAADPALTSLRDMSVATLHDALDEAIPPGLLDAPIASYTLSNLRYTPRQKLVMGLTSSQSIRPIALRVFPRAVLKNRLSKARCTHPHHSFSLRGLSTLAWVFPGERKLKLDILADFDRLSQVVDHYRKFRLENIELMHFVPEHTYTARISGVRPDGSTVEEYLKVFYDLGGAHTANIMKQLHYQLRNSDMLIPDSVSYVPEERVLLQSALQRDFETQLTDEQAATALARFHALSVVGMRENDDDYAASQRITQALVEAVFPGEAHGVSQVLALIREALAETPTGPRVLLHGDAHLGNLFPLQCGRVGVIDLDGMCWGAPEDDLASFFGFRLWLELRDGGTADDVLARFPDFIDAYNRQANHPVALTRAFAVLAQKLLTERIRRGITRGKIASGSELTGFLYAAICCLDNVWH